MTKFFCIVTALSCCWAVSAGELLKQNIAVYANIFKTPNKLTVNADKLFLPHRMAFPFATSSLVIDTYKPVRDLELRLALTKLAPAGKESASGLDKVQIWSGSDISALTPCSGFKVNITPAVRKNNIPGEDAEISGLPAARYFVLFVPRTRRGYVFGFADAAVDVTAYAPTPAVDVVSAKYQPLSDSDKALTANALVPVRAGYCDLLSGQAADKPAFSGRFGGGAAAWPSQGMNKGRRLLEAELPAPHSIKAIVVDLERLNMNLRHAEQESVLKKCVVYTSYDGKKWTEGKVDSVSVKYFSGDFSEDIKQIKGAKKYCTRVVFNGSWTGKFFRIDPAEYRGRAYVTGTRGVRGKIKFIPAQQAAVQKFQLPFSATGKVQAVLNISSRNKTAGKAILRLQDSGTVLWEKDFSELTLNVDNVIEFDLPSHISGRTAAELELIEKGVDSTLKYHRELIVQPGAICIKPASGTDKFTSRNYLSGGSWIELFSAASKHAALQFTVPVSGKYAVVATLRGRGKFKLNAPGIDKTVSLSVWHPEDYTDKLAGEEICGAGEFKANDKITFTALAKNSTVGNVKLLPLSDADMKIYTAASEIKPAVILHSDGYSEFFSHNVTKEFLARRIRNYPVNNVYCYDFCVGTSAVNYPSKAASIIGQQPNVSFWRNGDRLAAQRIKALHDSGVNPLTFLRDTTRKLNLLYSITLRANAFYPERSRAMNAQFFEDNPQFFQRFPDGRVKRQPSYAHPEVRQYYLGIVKEIAEARPDYLCIEFLRHPPFFQNDQPIIDEYIRRHGKYSAKDYGNEKFIKITQDIMFDYLKQVRAIIDAVDPAIKLAINFDCRHYLQHGIDAARIIKAGLVDMISPGIYEVGHEKFFDVKPFVAMAKSSPRQVKVFPRVECTIMGSDPTPEEEKGLVKVRRKNMSPNMLMDVFGRFIADGADGMRPFNGGGTWFAKSAADRSAVKRFTRFTVPYLDLRRELAAK